MSTPLERIEAGRQERRRDRQARRERKAEIRRNGGTPARRQYVWRVQPEVIWIPTGPRLSAYRSWASRPITCGSGIAFWRAWWPGWTARKAASQSLIATRWRAAGAA